MAVASKFLKMEYFLTKEKLKELEEELEALKTTGRKEVSESLKTAKELGDLSENAQYIEAREEQQRLERRILELEQTIRNATVISQRAKKRDEVEVGCTVEVLRDGKATKFFIVGSNEASPAEGFISNESPLGQELVGKKVGDILKISTPGGEVEYKIKSIN